MSASLPSAFEFLDVPVEVAARRLIGCELVTTSGPRVRVRIVETEAYDQEDPASHTFRGPTPRNAAMFLSAGHLYVYQSHGIHFCCNVVTGRADHGSGVLIRGAEPLDGADVMQARRGRGGVELTNGPGKLGQALGVDLTFTGSALDGSAERSLLLVPREETPAHLIEVGRRVGISKAADLPRRFYLRGNPYVSRHHGAPRPSRS
ncbi:DNA-3-methyladenine glycosylase [Microbacterium faecale]|uniref:DNA-3-methyladenine glycosylase n=1 Tax=Microbacterium faecale TaxID=1804630 RepID=UPI001E5753A7|nr:DNA-3-methyladenine glycosylase [Microbacterium faecale]